MSVVQEIDVTGNDISPYLQPFNLFAPPTGGRCTDLIKENRFNLKFKDSQSGTVSNLYCWEGIARQQPQCVIGSICSQYSYTEARTAFCNAYGGTPGGCGSNASANVFVPNVGNVPVLNERGGIIAYTTPGQCQGGFVNQFRCVTEGVRQSFSNVLDPGNRKNLIYTTVVLGIIIAIAFIYFAHKHKLHSHFKNIRVTK